ncbi:MAG: response regulator [Pseudomonadota bacterium]
MKNKIKKQTTSKNNSIYLYSCDETFVAELVLYFEQCQYQLLHFIKLLDFEAACVKQAPLAVIIDVDSKDKFVSFTDIVNKLKGKLDSTLPLIVVSMNDDIETRLAAVRANALRYLSKPLNPNILMQSIDSLTAREETPAPFRVLIVDDEIISLKSSRAVLIDAGMDVNILVKPLQCLKLLAEFKPDVIILDGYMPECSGLELAQIIRQDNAWDLIPIIFLSVETNLGYQMQAKSFGGDDFLVKPIQANILVSSVIARAKYSRRIRKLNKNVESALRETNFQVVTMDQHNAVSTTDVDGYITDVNDQFCQFSGYSREELLGQDNRLLNSNYHPHSFFADLWKTITQGKVWHGIICNRNKNTDLYWVKTTIVPFLDQKSRVYKYVSALTDITQLMQSEERLSFAVEGAGDGIWDWDMRTNIMQFSHLYEQMLGYAENELTQHINTRLNSIHPDDQIRSKEELKKYLDGLIPSHSIELRLRCKDGSYIWVLCRGTVVSHDNEGYPIRMIGIQSDISLQKETEEALLKSRKEADKANLAKSQFLSSMSHELRTPLNAIIGFGQLLKMKKNPRLSEFQLDNLDEILKAGNHLLELINEILELSKIEVGRIDIAIDTVLIDEIIDESIQLITPLAQKRGIEINTKQNGKLINFNQSSQYHYAVQADHTRLKQVLINLLTNAIKYNRVNGKIIIACDRKNNNWLHISVSDTGAGLNLQQQTELFTPFNRLGAEQTDIDGTGIGLVISKKLVELMKGKMGADCQSGDGCIFWIEFPMVSLAPVQNKSIENKKDSAVSSVISQSIHEYNVLYIEDNPANLRLVEQLLSESNYSIHMWSAHEAVLGLELAQEHKPDLILLDINLPGIDGFEVLKKLQQLELIEKTPVIAISANAMSRDIEKGLQAGFYDYITKPIDIKKLLNTVEETLQGLYTHNT